MLDDIPDNLWSFEYDLDSTTYPPACWLNEQMGWINSDPFIGLAPRTVMLQNAQIDCRLRRWWQFWKPRKTCRTTLRFVYSPAGFPEWEAANA